MPVHDLLRPRTGVGRYRPGAHRSNPRIWRRNAGITPGPLIPAVAAMSSSRTPRNLTANCPAAAPAARPGGRPSPGHAGSAGARHRPVPHLGRRVGHSGPEAGRDLVRRTRRPTGAARRSPTRTTCCEERTEHRPRQCDHRRESPLLRSTTRKPISTDPGVRSDTAQHADTAPTRR